MEERESLRNLKRGNRYHVLLPFLVFWIDHEETALSEFYLWYLSIEFQMSVMFLSINEFWKTTQRKR